METEDITLRPDDVSVIVAGFEKTTVHTNNELALLYEALHPTGEFQPQEHLLDTPHLSQLLRSRSPDVYIYSSSYLDGTEEALIRRIASEAKMDLETGSGYWRVSRPDASKGASSLALLGATPEHRGLQFAIADPQDVQPFVDQVDFNEVRDFSMRRPF
jgi:hypothetical protein